MKLRLFNRFALAQDGYAQFVPKGEYPWFDAATGEGLIQVVDDVALQRLRETFPAELLIDKEHLAARDPRHGDAMGWGDGPASAEVREDGLYVRPRWSDLGVSNIEGGRVRYVSPVFCGETLEPLGTDEHTGLPRYRVTRLLEAALTNKPNMRGIKAISNRNPGGPVEKQPGSGGPAAANKENQTTDMKLVNRVLDLSPDASEDAAAAGIEKLKKERDDAKATLANRETALATAQAGIATRDEAIKALKTELANRDNAHADALLDSAEIKDDAARKRWKA